ncbi:MAG: hypothetical protein DRQ10_06585 [Candidatus Hydrothermota bacterium]|nr:MAG: hypothetical protein DRQ10_06585 [Candidatus Hydrothermae bacterium]
MGRLIVILVLLMGLVLLVANKEFCAQKSEQRKPKDEGVQLVTRSKADSAKPVKDSLGVVDTTVQESQKTAPKSQD